MQSDTDSLNGIDLVGLMFNLIVFVLFAGSLIAAWIIS
jgi:hypothetical protein